MGNPDQDNLRELLERFMGPTEAESAAQDIRDADETLRAYPAPEPRAETIVGIKLQIATKLSSRRKTVHLLRRALGAAAAVVILAILALLSRAPQTGPAISHAALIPTTIWESDDISSDDMQIAYFAAEIRHIEAQVHALEAGHGPDNGAATLHEIETELMEINTEFWKE